MKTTHLYKYRNSWLLRLVRLEETSLAKASISSLAWMTKSLGSGETDSPFFHLRVTILFYQSWRKATYSLPCLIIS